MEHQMDHGTCSLAGIELFNFKSYRGKHVIGPFSSLTAIIGPNGSGKSNLMDAISFVLVMRTEKLRAKSISSLVNHSHDTNFDECEPAYVKLIFKNNDTLSHFTIRRSFSTNGKSRYFIDDLLVSKDEYLDFLIRIGFNAKNKIFLIFHGTIDSLITQNPKAFTVIMEEISGSAEFKETYDSLKDQCFEKDKELHKLFTKKKNLIKSRKFLNFLDQQSLKNAELLEEIESLKADFTLLELYSNSKQIELSEKNLSDNHTKLGTIQVKIDDIIKQKSEITKEIDKEEKIVVQLASQLREMEFDEYLNFKLDYLKRKENIDHISKRIKNANTNHNKALNKLTKSKQLIADLEKKICDFKEQREVIKRKVVQQRGTINEADINEYKRLKNILLEQSAITVSSFSGIRKNLFNLQENCKFYNIDKTELQRQLEELTSQSQQTDDLDEDIKQCSNEINVLLDKKEALFLKLQEVKELSERSKEDLDKCLTRLSKKTILKKWNKKNERDKTFLQYLKQNYPGVIGRFGELCRPKHKRFSKAYSVVTRKYCNAIVVDSFRTLSTILTNEKSEFLYSQHFLCSDTVKAVTLNTNLRTSRTVSLVYDMLDFSANIERVVRFVVGNTVFCTTNEDACSFAYRDSTNRINTISADGANFWANGSISMDFSSNQNTKWSSMDIEEYNQWIRQKNALQDSYSQHCKRLNLITQDIDSIDETIQCLESQRKSLQKTKLLQDNKKSEVEDKMKKTIEELKKVDLELANVELQISKIEENISVFQDELSQHEQRIFGDFLARLNFNTLKQFEALHFNMLEDDLKLLSDCENSLIELESKLRMEQEKQLNETVNSWAKVIEDENRLLQQSIDACELSKSRFEEEENKLNNLKNTCDSKNKLLNQSKLQLKLLEEELTLFLDQLEKTNKSILKLDSNLRLLKSQRHELYKNAFTEAISLPFLHNQDEFDNIFNDLARFDNDEHLFQLEDQLILDFDKFSHMSGESEEVLKEKNYLEIERNKKENEIQKLTLSDESLHSRQNELRRNIRAIESEIQELKNELAEIKPKFDDVKQRRSSMLKDFLQDVADKLDQIYKEIMQSDSAQAFLVADNSEEPYLGGIHFNCIVPAKVFQPITCLSGGEKTLAAFAFIFASYLHRYPAFFIMDEIDSPLDNQNIAKFVNFLELKSNECRFILISHKFELVSHANSLLGVFKEMDENKEIMSSKTLTIDLTNDFLNQEVSF